MGLRSRRGRTTGDLRIDHQRQRVRARALSMRRRAARMQRNDRRIRDGHFVAVIGGSNRRRRSRKPVGGPWRLGRRIRTERSRPYGKIEDGLPRWHEALRNKEYKTISTRSSRSRAWLVCSEHENRCRHRLCQELVNDWGFSAVVLANGAWLDRLIAHRRRG